MRAVFLLPYKKTFGFAPPRLESASTILLAADGVSFVMRNTAAADISRRSVARSCSKYQQQRIEIHYTPTNTPRRVSEPSELGDYTSLWLLAQHRYELVRPSN